MNEITEQLLEVCQEAYSILATDIGYEGGFMNKLAKVVSKAGGKLEAVFLQDAIEVKCPICQCGTVIEGEFIKKGYSDYECKVCAAPFTYNSLR